MKDHCWCNASTRHPLQWRCSGCSASIISADHPSKADGWVTVLTNRGSSWLPVDVPADCNEAVCGKVLTS